MISKPDLIKLYIYEHKSYQQIADMYRISIQTVLRYMRRHAIQARCGYGSGKIVLSDNVKVSIARLYKSGLNRLSIAQRLGITEHSVRMVLASIPKINITTIRNTHIPTEEGLQCMLGTLLGDGSITPTRSGYQLAITHCAAQRDYLEHKRKLIGAPSLMELRKSANSYSPGSIYYKISYENKGCLQKIWNIVTHNNKKTVNKEWLSLLTPVGLAYWFMDDGSSSYNKGGKIYVRFASMGFSYAENILLMNKLSEYGLTPRLNKSSYGSGVLIGLGPSSGAFIDMVAPIIDKIPSMRYKLKYPA